MSDTKKTVKVGKQNIRMNPQSMYMRLLAINIMKKIPLKRVMSFENSVPISLFRLLNATKSKFMHNIEDLLSNKSHNSLDLLVFQYNGRMLPTFQVEFRVLTPAAQSHGQNGRNLVYRE